MISNKSKKSTRPLTSLKLGLWPRGLRRKKVWIERKLSHVVRFPSICMVLSIVAHMDLDLHQMDVKTTFLNGDLDEEIYMKQPIGLVEKGLDDKVYKHNKSIYDLKQSLRQWQFHTTITSNGFSMFYKDHCVYIK